MFKTFVYLLSGHVSYLTCTDRRGQTCSKKKHNDIYQNMEHIQTPHWYAPNV